MAERSLIAIVTPAFGSPESVEALKREVDGTSTEIRLVAPAVEANPLHHTLGDIDEPREQAAERLKVAVAAARDAGLDVSFEVGDPDPVQAAQDALFKGPADEILTAETSGGDAQKDEKGAKGKELTRQTGNENKKQKKPAKNETTKRHAEKPRPTTDEQQKPNATEH